MAFHARRVAAGHRAAMDARGRVWIRAGSRPTALTATLLVPAARRGFLRGRGRAACQTPRVAFPQPRGRAFPWGRLFPRADLQSPVHIEETALMCRRPVPRGRRTSHCRGRLSGPCPAWAPLSSPVPGWASLLQGCQGAGQLGQRRPEAAYCPLHLAPSQSAPQALRPPLAELPCCPVAAPSRWAGQGCPGLWPGVQVCNGGPRNVCLRTTVSVGRTGLRWTWAEHPYSGGWGLAPRV